MSLVTIPRRNVLGSASPFRVAERLMSDMDNFWGGNSVSDFFGNNSPLSGSNTSELSCSEDRKTYRLRVAVPGFSREELAVDVSKNHISIDATRAEPKAQDGFVPIRQALPLSLSFREQIPATLDPSTVDAELKDGILTVTISAVQKEPKGNRIVIR